MVNLSIPQDGGKGTSSKEVVFQCQNAVEKVQVSWHTKEVTEAYCVKDTPEEWSNTWNHLFIVMKVN